MSFCHEGPQEEADCQQWPTRAHPERKLHPNGDKLFVYSQVCPILRSGKILLMLSRKI